MREPTAARALSSLVPAARFGPETLRPLEAFQAGQVFSDVYSMQYGILNASEPVFFSISDMMGRLWGGAGRVDVAAACS